MRLQNEIIETDDIVGLAEFSRIAEELEVLELQEKNIFCVLPLFVMDHFFKEKLLQITVNNVRTWPLHSSRHSIHVNYVLRISYISIDLKFKFKDQSQPAALEIFRVVCVRHKSSLASPPIPHNHMLRLISARLSAIIEVLQSRALKRIPIML